MELGLMIMGHLTSRNETDNIVGSLSVRPKQTSLILQA